MHTINKLLAVLLMSMLLVYCKGKKTKLENGDAETTADFIDFFSPATLPFMITDSMLVKKETDSSAVIDYAIFAKFVPDTLLSKQFGPVKPVIYPLGKVALEEAETYLFIKAAAPGKKVGYVLAFDKEKFVAGLALVSTGKNAMPYQKAGMDKKYTVSQTFEQKGEDEIINELRNIYILNGEAREFSKIVTDEGIANQVQDVINPLDTLPRSGKFAGDYIKDKRNFISVRDGKNPATLLFFVHFEKNEGCTGEIKGEATISGAKTAVYRATGNPCVLELTFTGNKVSLKEAEACGSYRDIKCFFEGSYGKKGEAQNGQKKKKNTVI